MAPSSQAAYFPALDKCLNREQPLLSWESAYRTFSLPDSQEVPSAVHGFLRDESVASILANPLAPFASPSPQTKSDFDTRTAAIHVLPSSDGQYDIDQIKKDALWLSKEAGVDEVSALRIVLLEWQNKAAAQLLGEWSEEERLSVQNVTANATFSASTPAFGDTGLAAAQRSLFDNEELRQARLLKMLFTEQTSVLSLSAALLGFVLPEDYQPTSSDAVPRPALIDVAKAVRDAQTGDPYATSPRSFFTECCTALNTRAAVLFDPSRWPKPVTEDAELTTFYAKSALDQIVLVLRLAFYHTFTSRDVTSAKAMIAWFELMDQHMFFSELPELPDAADAVIVIQCLVTLISVSVIEIKKVIEYLVQSAQNDVTYPELYAKSYWEDDQCVRLITNTLLGAVAQRIRHAGPAILAWSVVAQNLRDIAAATRAERQHEDLGENDRPLSRASLQDSRIPPTKFDNSLDLILDTVPGDDPIAIMANSAVGDLRAFDLITSVSEVLLLSFPTPADLHVAICGKSVLYSLIQEGYSLFQYGPDLVQSVLSIISYDTVPPNLSHSRRRNPAMPVKTLLTDGLGMGARFLDQVVKRYPYELRPFLKTLLSISQSRASLSGDESDVLRILEPMVSFTQALPLDFEDYDLVQEDEMTNCIQLTTELPVLSPQGLKGRSVLLTAAKSVLEAPKDLNAIQVGTIGTVVSEQRPFVVCWQHAHLGLEYLGSLLSTRLANATFVDSFSRQPVDKETAAEVIALADSLVSNEISVQNVEAAKHVLSQMSARLERDDIVRIIFDIFEEELQAQIDYPAAEGSLYLLVHCTRFLQSVLAVYPDRIWSLLTRSKLLSLGDNTGALATIVTATELPLGQYDFLRSCVGLYEDLIEDSVARAVSRKTTTKALTRFDERDSSSASTPEKLMSETLASFQTIMLDVLQSSPSWKFVFGSERCEINTRILDAMTKVLVSVYSIDDESPASSKLTGVLASTATIILRSFMAENPHELTFHPILTIFVAAIADADSTGVDERLSRDQTISAITFCTMALEVGLMSTQKSTYLTKNLLQIMPLIARLFASRHYYKGHIAELMSCIVRSLNTTAGEPASLLGHLGSDAMKCFLAVLAELDLPLQDISTEVAIWDLLTAIVSNKQQWLAVCVLTGSTPRDKLKQKDADKPTVKVRKPLFTYALEQLVDFSMLSPKRAIAILKFIARAQDHWSWATNSIGQHIEVIRNLTNWLAELTPNPRPHDMEAVTRAANENKMAALIVDIIARYLHNASQVGDTTIAKMVGKKLQYLRDHGVTVDAYNHSLHKNLIKNFEAKFTQCSLSGFKRTVLIDTEFGRDYYYSRYAASTMLAFDPSWSRKNGFRDEFARANVNLSLVESQVELLKSWKALAIGLGQFASEDTPLQKELAAVASNCLKANMEASVPTVLFDDIAQIRADLAFVLLQRLTLIHSKEKEFEDLLSTVWDTVRTCSQDFETATTTREANYYRTLLRILFLAIQPHIYNRAPAPAPGRSTLGTQNGSSPSIASTLLEILERVVTVNFRALCSAVHADPTSIEPADFVLLTALLQSILRVPGMNGCHASVAAIFASAGTARYAAGLYSWADQLAAVVSEARDPIYGELSILFLLELSSVPLLAEQMAVDGLLSRISSANLSQYLRKASGKGPFDEPTRMFSIWSRGMLPLCLNLLEAVGPPIAAEIGAFINSFPEQLGRAELDLEYRQPTLRHPYAGNVTLGMAAETHSLSLISLILAQLKASGPAVGINADEVPTLVYDRAGVKEDVENLLKSRRSLKERIVPVGEREVAWVKQKPTATGHSESRLEERIVAELEASLTCLSG